MKSVHLNQPLEANETDLVVYDGDLARVDSSVGVSRIYSAGTRKTQHVGARGGGAKAEII